MARSTTVAALRAQLAAIAEEITRLEARPDEPAPGSVIKFTMQFHEGGVRYTYAAISAGGGWYTTGTGPRRATWERLLDWMAAHGTTEFELLRPAAKGQRIKIDG